ncbi:MAG: extracellular solute-binding protein [Oscillospiraceae bacterium]|nr:extracellular solute-binding protein [Oscillospiraceae bacterium]
MKKRLTFTAILLATVLIFTACGGGGGSTTEEGPIVGTVFAEYVYVPEFIDLPMMDDNVQGITVHGDRIFYYYLHHERDEIENEAEIDWDNWQPPTPDIVVASVLADGSDLQEIRIPAPGSSIELSAVRVTDDGHIAMLMSHQEWSDFGAETTVFYMEYDMAGNQISSREIDGLVPENSNWFHMSQAILLQDGGAALYVMSDTSGEQIFLLDSNFTVTGQLDTDWVQGMTQLDDGRVLALSSQWDTATQTTHSTLQELDIAAGALGAEHPFTMANAHQLFPAREGSEFDLYIGDANHLFGYSFDTGERALLLNWIEAGIVSDGGSHIGFLPDGRIAVLTMDFGIGRMGNMAISRSDSLMTELAVLTRTARADLPEREVITIGGFNFWGEINRQVVAFNRVSQTHEIQVQDFSIYNTTDDFGAGRTRFLAAMGAGHGPDIVWGSLVDLFPLVDRGLLEDLYSYMDADSVLNRSDFLANILQALETEDGTLPLMGNSFGISTMVGMADTAPEKEDWNLAALLDLIEQTPPGTSPMGDWLTAESFLSSMLFFSGDEFIDWSNGTADLDSEAFIDLLEIAYRLPREIDDNIDWTEFVSEHTRMVQGEQFVMMSQIWSADTSMQVYSAMGDVRFLGMPTNEGGAHVLHVEAGFGINSGSEHKDAAWDFVRQFLLADARIDWQLPIRIDRFEAAIEEAMTPETFIDEDGNEVEQSQGGMGFGDGFMVDLYALTEEEAATLRELVSAASLLGRGDEAVSEMITEELLPFLAGDRSAADTARILQNRITTLLRERS